MSIDLIHPIQPLPPALPEEAAAAAPGRSFANSFAAALDAVARDLAHADATTVAAAEGRGSIERAAIERARADVELQMAAVAASRVSSALNQLLQTQV